MDTELKYGILCNLIFVYLELNLLFFFLDVLQSSLMTNKQSLSVLVINNYYCTYLWRRMLIFSRRQITLSSFVFSYLISVHLLNIFPLLRYLFLIYYLNSCTAYYLNAWSAFFHILVLSSIILSISCGIHGFFGVFFTLRIHSLMFFRNVRNVSHPRIASTDPCRLVKSVYFLFYQVNREQQMADCRNCLSQEWMPSFLAQ